MSTELAMPFNHLNLCHPLLLLPSIFLSIRCFSYESTLHIRCCKYWSFRFTISPSNEYSGLISFRINRFDLLVVQGTLKRLLSQFSNSVLSDVLWHHRLQHCKACMSTPTPGAYSNSCPSSRWCHPTISTSVVPFSTCLQSFPASQFFPMSQFFPSGGQSTGVSASASVLPMNIQDWSPLGWTGWISLQSKGLPRVFSNTTLPKHQLFSTQLSL